MKIFKMAIGCVHNFIKELSKINRVPNTVRFYRGQCKTGWSLIPSIYRNEKYGKLQEIEFKILDELKSLYPETFKGCTNKFEELVQAQHYEIPTRLLDITSNPLVALFFACQRDSTIKGNAEVFIFDVPHEYIAYYNDDITLKFINNNNLKKYTEHKCICVKARLTNPRIIRQHGAFLLFNGPLESNDILPPFINNPKRIIIHNNNLSMILKQLRDINVSDEFLFPELPKYAEVLKRGEINI